MGGVERAIEETLADPERVFDSFTDPDARLYYRLYAGVQVRTFLSLPLI